MDLSWKDNATDETGFKVERSVGTGAYGQIVALSADVVTVNDDLRELAVAATRRWLEARA